MSKSNKSKSRKKKSNAKKSKSTKTPPISKIQESLNEETQKTQIINIKHKNRQRKIKNVSETIEQLIFTFMRLSCFFAFAVALIAIFIAIIVSIVLYIKQNEVAVIALTVLQVLTGIVSLVVGIWALVLTIQANHKNLTTQNNLNMVVSSANTIVTQVEEENDVNMDSL